jgi:hypothetical protein
MVHKAIQSTAANFSELTAMFGQTFMVFGLLVFGRILKLRVNARITNIEQSARLAIGYLFAHFKQSKSAFFVVCGRNSRSRSVLSFYRLFGQNPYARR